MPSNDKWQRWRKIVGMRGIHGDTVTKALRKMRPEQRWEFFVRLCKTIKRKQGAK